MDDTSESERAEMMALALLDGWGEEWQEIAATVHNVNVTKTEHLRTPEEMRRLQNLDPPKKTTREEWQSLDAQFCKIITGKNHGSLRKT